MATQLTIVNKILSRLRETEVSSVAASSYAKLMAIFINEAKEQLEDMWFWSVNETEIDTSILADGTLTYDLTATNDRSFLIRGFNDQYPHAYDVTDGKEGQIYDITLKERNYIRNTYKGTPPTTETPVVFALQPDADGRGYTLALLWGSSAARTWRTYWYAPQAALATDGTADATEILLPERPIYTLALMLAANERGEEMGEPGGILERQANNATAAAMEIDMQISSNNAGADMTNLENLRNSISDMH